MSERMDQARAEAYLHRKRFDLSSDYGLGFMDGVEWADANPQPRTITQEDREELMYKLVGIEMMAMGPDVDMILDFLGIQVEEE